MLTKVEIGQHYKQNKLNCVSCVIDRRLIKQQSISGKIPNSNSGTPNMHPPPILHSNHPLTYIHTQCA